MQRLINSQTFSSDTQLVRLVGKDVLENTFGINITANSVDEFINKAVNQINKKLGKQVTLEAFVSASSDESKNFVKHKPVQYTILCDKGTYGYKTNNYGESEVI